MLLFPTAPIDAAHIFPPTQDLADKSLHGINGCLAFIVGLFGPLTNFHRA